MRIIQIPFSHNCIKVRRALEIKGLPFEVQDIHPLKRQPVLDATGQSKVPALIDGDVRMAESTAILHYLETAHPEPSLLPEDPACHAQCWLIEDWADAAFMQLTQRMAYWQILATPGALEMLFFPDARGLKRRLMVRRARQVLTRRFKLSEEANRVDEAEAVRLAGVAVDRIDGKRYLFGERVTVADIGLAAMVAPLRIGAEPLRREPAVSALLTWAEPILGEEVLRRYTPHPH